MYQHVKERLEVFLSSEGFYSNNVLGGGIN